MNRYTARHKILEYFKLEMDKQTSMIPLLEIDYDRFCNGIKGLTRDEVSTYLIIMRNEGYFKFREDKAIKEKYAVQITTKGLIDFADRKFQRKRNRILFRTIKECSITAANIAVAIIAFFALRKPNEIKQLEGELKQINSRLLQIEANPNLKNLNTTHYILPTQSDSSR